jgi:hypothetical protein
MKASIAISLLILAAAAFIGWGDHRTLDGMRSEHARLTAEASALGILSLDPDHPEKGLRITKRGRTDKKAQAHQAARDIIAFAKELEALKKSGKEPDEATQARILELLDRMLSLDAGQLKVLIDEFRASTEVGDETREGMISFTIMTLAKDHPEAALKLFTESEDLIDKERMGKNILSVSLSNWAGTDPGGALEWVRKNGGKYPDLITEQVKAGLLKGAASRGIAVGFDVMRQLEFEHPESALRELAGAVESPAERTEFLNLFRKYLEASPQADGDQTMSQLTHLGKGIAKDGFEQGSRWIAENKLSEKEIAAFAGSVAWQAESAEKGKWIEWMGKTLPGEERDNSIGSIMVNWTNNDYRAAGEWLAAAPDGPAKAASVSAYAETVAPHDPQAAAQWALTLPPGEKRQDTLEVIHRNWPADTEEGKAQRSAFAEKHGIR